MIEIASALRRVGLTVYESSAYASLVDKRFLKAEEISKASGIPNTRVYGTLDQLVQKGLARLIPGRPRRYECTSPSVGARMYIGFLKRSFETRMNEVRRGMELIEKEVEPLYWKSHLEVKPEELIEPLSNLAEMESRTRRFIRGARNEILISSALFTWIRKVYRDLKKSARRGVETRILVQQGRHCSNRWLRELVRAGAKVRASKNLWHPVRGTLVDDRNLCFVIWASEEPETYWNPKVYRPHHTENPGLTRIFRESFELRWVQSRRFAA